MAVVIENPGTPPEVNSYSAVDSEFTAQRLSEGDAAIADILKGLGTESQTVAGIDTVMPEDVVIPSESAVKAEEEPAPTPKEPAPTPPEEKAPEPSAEESRGLMRLLEREKAASDREALLEKREREQVSKLQELESKLSKSVSPQDIAKRIDEDVLSFFTEAGLDPVQVSRQIIGATLGDKAPPEIRDAAEKYRRQKELAEIRNSITEMKFQEQVAKVKSDVSGFVGSTLPGESKYPTLRAVAAVDRTAVEEALLGEIGRDAQERGIKEPGEKLLSREEAAAKLEARWEVFRRAFAAAAPTVPAGTAPAPATTVPQGSNGKTVETKTEQKRPVPPRRYWQGERDDEVASALTEALAIATRKTV